MLTQRFTDLLFKSACVLSIACQIYALPNLYAASPIPLLHKVLRSTPAYQADERECSRVAPNTPILRTVASCSASDGVCRFGEGVGGANIHPLRQNSRYMFGYGTDGWLYRSSNGFAWSRVSNVPLAHLLALNDGSIMRTWINDDSRVAVAVSHDDGENWERSVWEGTGEPFLWLTEGAYLPEQGWGLYEAQNGTVVMVEYKFPYCGKYIYRSGDGGHTWRVVHDGGSTFMHYHATVKQENLGRWIAVTGDGLQWQHLLASDDDALTWYSLTQFGQKCFQPTYLLDFGDPTRLLFGSDTVWQVGVVDVSDEPSFFEIEYCFNNWDRRFGRNLSAQVFEHDGVYYGCNWDSSDWPRYPVISVSRDLQHWAVYHRYSVNEVGVYGYGGFRTGKLQLKVHTPEPANKHMVLSPAAVATTSAIQISSKADNLYSSEALSSCESPDGWIDQSDPAPPGSVYFGCTDALAHHGSTCLQYSRTDGGAMRLLGPSFPVGCGKTYQARIWIRGSGYDLTVRWNRDGSDVGNYFICAMSPARWQEIVLEPITASQRTSDLRFVLRMRSTSDNRCELFLDSIQVTEAPCPTWHVGGQTRASTVAQTQFTAMGNWTNVFSIQPEDICSNLLGPEELHIRSIRSQDGATVLGLSFDPVGRSYVLRSLVNDTVASEIRTSRQHFHRFEQVRFALSCKDTQVRLCVNGGQPTETLSMPGLPALSSGTITICSGCLEQPLLDHWLFCDLMYDQYLDTAGIAQAMNVLVEPLLGDLDSDHTVGLYDLAELLSHYGTSSGVTYWQGDLDGNGIINVEDLATMLSQYGRTKSDGAD